MEILILQYSILVLICFWWARPSKEIALGQHLKIPFFNLQCFLVLMFVGGYTFLRELALKADGHWSYLLLYSAMNLCLFCLIPAGYLCARNKIAQGKTGMQDIIHIASPVLYTLFFIVPYLVSPIESFRESPDTWLFYKVFGYCVLGIYLLLVMQFLIDKYSIFGYPAKNEKISQPELSPPASPPASPSVKVGPVLEVQVGSTQFDSAQLAKIDHDLRTFISAKKPFLQRGYNLRQLSEDTSIPLHHLSAFINQFYQVHYNDFINEYRVHYCQAKIRNDEWRAKTLEAIAEESGFNNRNTFTTAFKKVTGSNPSEYLKMVKHRELV